jgi:antitoxin component YwqK of YwqJK toxin-antitoxin module
VIISSSKLLFSSLPLLVIFQELFTDFSLLFILLQENSTMPKTTLIFCFIFCTFFVHAQNKKDVHGKRTGKWVYTGADKPNSGISKSGKVEEGIYVAGRKEGIWTKYHKDGKTPKLKGNYSDNRPEGSFTRFYSNGRIMEQGSFGKNGYKGNLVRYFENGIPSYKAVYNNDGQETGKVQYFHENGKIALEYSMKNGTLTGTVNRYNTQGNLVESFEVSATGALTNKKNFSNVQQPRPPVSSLESVIYPPRIANPRMKGLKFVTNGYNKVYNDNDEIWMEGEFKNGQLWDGKVYDYDADGILQKVRIFKAGRYHSDGQL